MTNAVFDTNEFGSTVAIKHILDSLDKPAAPFGAGDDLQPLFDVLAYVFVALAAAAGAIGGMAIAG